MTTLDPTLARPHHLLPFIPVRQRGELPLGPQILKQVIIDAALPYGRRLLLLRRYRKLCRQGLQVA